MTLIWVTAGTVGASAKTTWLCNPSAKKDPCRGSLTATILKSSGKSTVEHRSNARNPKVDCFYVYPTVSDQKTTNANLKKDPEILAIAKWQASRFSEHCRVWAPVYRQLTLAAIQKPVPPAAATKAYKSVLSGWRDYLAHHNHGRGVVLIGHSQGTFVLRQLIKAEIDKRPKVRRRVVSAILLGGNVLVRKGKDAGGDFKNLPACRSTGQTGCVVAYSMFGDTPPKDALFARVTPAQAKQGLQVLCTNPAAIGAGGAGTYLLRPYAASSFFPGTIGLGVRIFEGETPDVPTPWFSPPGKYKASCSTAGGASFLHVVASDGARVPHPTPDETWGYHLGDVNLAYGNLVKLVGQQAAAYLRR